ncbi:cytoplasmic dynein 2 intermediate chain 2-like isoform X2 [Lycorma delicatula]|uniref:cytoplasmic dynein 2 intermediate chain 2-like isoform X2 n=1 Tax=Lycorma delicatula TaxID=130591 RepID=UPI003F51042A
MELAYSWTRISSRSSGETGTQTNDLLGVDKDEQTTYKVDIEVQTDSSEQINVASNVDEEALASFLDKICPKVLEELDKSSKSKAFLSYHLPDEDASQEVKNIHNLLKPKNQVQYDLKVNSLTWSCTGGVVVVALGSPNHDDWCSHTGFIHFYNINRSTSVSMTPSKILEATSCVTSVATHPYEPSILASGLFRGNVILWNLQKEGAECISTIHSHNEPVTQISWISVPSSRPLIASSGLDGRMNIWNPSSLYESINLKESHVLSSTDASVEPGITCFSFSSCRPGVFVAALEGGKIIHCFINATTSTSKVGYKVPLSNPVVGELEGHKGLVTCLSFSPYHEDLFLSVGIDQEIHVNSIFELAPLKTIWCEVEVLGVAWSPSQANVFISWGQSAEIIVYDSKKGSKLSSLKTNEVSTLCTSSFNWKRVNTVKLQLNYDQLAYDKPKTSCCWRYYWKRLHLASSSVLQYRKVII